MHIYETEIRGAILAMAAAGSTVGPDQIQGPHRTFNKRQKTADLVGGSG